MFDILDHSCSPAEEKDGGEDREVVEYLPWSCVCYEYLHPYTCVVASDDYSLLEEPFGC